MGYFTTGLPQLPLNTDPKVTQDLTDVFNAVRNLADKLGVALGLDTITGAITIASTVTPIKRKLIVPAGVAMSYGNIVTFTLTGGVLKAFKAGAAASQCGGICNTVGGLALNQVGEFVLEGLVTSVGGLTAGKNYEMSPTTGLIQPVGTGFPGAGYFTQGVGLALSATELLFRPDMRYYFS